MLVDEILARALGVCREAPDGRTGAEYREGMRDLELQAAKRSVGIWAKINWEKLPEERRQQRAEEAGLGLAAGTAGAQKDLVLDRKTAARDELLKPPGIGERMADRIIEVRPSRSWKTCWKCQGSAARRGRNSVRIW